MTRLENAQISKNHPSPIPSWSIDIAVSMTSQGCVAADLRRRSRRLLQCTPREPDIGWISNWWHLDAESDGNGPEGFHRSAIVHLQADVSRQKILHSHTSPPVVQDQRKKCPLQSQAGLTTPLAHWLIPRQCQLSGLIQRESQR